MDDELERRLQRMEAKCRAYGLVLEQVVIGATRDEPDPSRAMRALFDRVNLTLDWIDDHEERPELQPKTAAVRKVVGEFFFYVDKMLAAGAQSSETR